MENDEVQVCYGGGMEMCVCVCVYRLELHNRY